MHLSCSINLEFEDEHKKTIFYDLLRAHAEGEIKGRAKITFKDNRIHIEAKDISAFKIAISSLIRHISVLEDAWDI